MADSRSAVGLNRLIVENIVRFCDLRTKKSCRLVNKVWQTATLKHIWLWNVSRDDRYEPDPRFLALLHESLNPFRNIHLWSVVQPQLLGCLKNSLRSLELSKVYFRTIADMEKVLFTNFESMKVLILDRVGVEIQDNRVPSPNGALRDMTPAIAKDLESLTIDMGNRDDWKSQEQPGVLVLGLDTLFHKFYKIKTLKFHMGNHRPDSDVFAVLLEGRIALQTLLFNSSMFVPDSMAEYLTTYGDRLLHVEAVINSEERDMERFKNVNVGSWLSVRMDRADWNTFGRGTFKNLQQLKIVRRKVESFDFLCRMPVLKEIKWVDGHWNDDDNEGRVTSLDRNAPCETVTKIDLGFFKNYNYKLYFKVFPNVTQLKGGCTGEQLRELVNQWPVLTKLHLLEVKGSEVAEVTRNVMRLEALENFWYCSWLETFGDDEGKQFLLHPRLTYLRLLKISMSPWMIRLLKQKLVEFEFVFLNEFRQMDVRANDWLE